MLELLDSQCCDDIYRTVDQHFLRNKSELGLRKKKASVLEKVEREHEQTRNRFIVCND